MFKDELKKLRLQKGISQAKLADDLGLSTSTIGMYESGKREPKELELLELIADYFNVNIDTLVSGQLSATKIPVLGRVVAGIPLEAIEEIIDYEEIPHSMAMTGEYFGLQVQGNSMEPRIKAGDTVIVKKQSYLENGEIGIILVNGNEATIKRIRIFEGGIALVPNNNDYEVMTYTKEEIETLPVRIIGKVVELRAKF